MKNSVKLFVSGILILSGILHSCKKEEIPTLSTTAITNITATSATSGGYITSDGEASIIARGICWNTAENPTTNDSKTTDGDGIGQFVSNISELNAGTTYHVRAYATNGVGTAYGADMTFATIGQLPSCLTQPATDISATGGTLNGTVNANYLSTTVTFEYGTTTSYGLSVTATQSPVTGNTLANVNVVLSGLTSGTTYHFRVKAVNSVGTEYGDDMIFATSGQLPSCSTQTATNISATGGTLNGTVNANNLSTIVTFEYGTTTSYGQTETASQSPVTGNTITNVNVVISGLTAGTTYHYRIKAVNSVGTGYGDDMIFATSGQLPSCSTQPATDITTKEAMLYGTVNANNLSTIVTFECGETTSYGLLVTATQSPITGNAITIVNAQVIGLSAGTTYHYRIKTVNSVGTVYGDDLSFITLGQAPLCVSLQATNISTTLATLNGTVNPRYLSTTVTFEYGTTSSYGQTVTATQNPVTGSSITNVSANISGLTLGTSYHFRIKAVNYLGTTYGDDMEFNTLSTLPTVTDIDGNVYNTIIIGSQVWLNENLRTSHYNNGDEIPTTMTLTDLTQTVNPKYQWTVNNPNDNTVPDSKCYTWYVVIDDRGICPVGYRVASNDDWNILETYLAENGYGNSISKYNVSKSIAASSGWLISYLEGTVGYQQELNNSTGFNILPYGGVSPESYGVSLGVYGRQPPFWTSTNKGDQLNIRAITKLINYQQSWIITSDYPKNWGFGVRCIKNN